MPGNGKCESCGSYLPSSKWYANTFPAQSQSQSCFIPIQLAIVIVAARVRVQYQSAAAHLYLTPESAHGTAWPWGGAAAAAEEAAVKTAGIERNASETSDTSEESAEISEPAVVVDKVIFMHIPNCA